MRTATGIVSATGTLLLLATLSAAQTSPPTRWVSPCFTDSSPYLFTYGVVLNAGTTTDTVTITFHDRSGSVLCSEPRPLVPGAAWYFSTMWLPGVRGQSGSIVVTSATGTVRNLKVWSSIIAGLQSSAWFASLAGSWDPSPAGDGWISPLLMAQGTSIYTLARVMNTGVSAQTVTVEYFSGSGTLVFQTQSVLAAGASWDLNTYADSRTQSLGTGWMRIRGSNGRSLDLAPWSTVVIWGATAWTAPGTWYAR